MDRTYTVRDEIGLHARPASILSQEASKYPNNITITYKDKTITLKSIIAVMSLGIPYGHEFVISIDGENAEVVFEHLEAVLKLHSVI